MSVNKLLHDCTPIIFYVCELLQNQNYIGQGAIFRMQFSTVGFFCLFVFERHTPSSVLQHYIGKSGQEIVFHTLSFSRPNISLRSVQSSSKIIL